MTEIEIKIDGDVSDADALHVAKQITATGARYRVTGPLAEALARMNAAAYERGQRDMRDRAAGVAKHRHKQWRMPHKDDAAPGEVCCDVSACEDIAAAIRALTTDRGDG